MIPGSEDTRYTFPIGVVRVWETKLLTKVHYDRLISLPDEKGIISSLHDTIYGQFRDLDFEDVLDKVLDNAFKFLVKYCQDPEIIDLILLPKRIHNLKVQFKGQVTEREYDRLLYDVESMDIPGVEGVVASFLENKDPFLLDAGLDRIEIETAVKLAGKFPFLVDYYELKADLFNIISLIRLKRLGLGKKTGEFVFVSSPSFKTDHIVSLLEQDFDAIKSFVARSPYHQFVIQGLDFLESKNSFLRIERLADEELLGYMRKARRFVFGVEPMFSYYSFLEAEVIRLRRIYIGKRHNLPVEEIKESLPEVY